MAERDVRIFLVEDNDGLRSLMKVALEESGFLVEDFSRGKAFLKRTTSVVPDFLVLDYKLPDMKTSHVLDELEKKELHIPFLIVTGHGDEKIAVEMMKRGAVDYLIKDMKLLDVLPGMVRRAVQELLTREKLETTELKLSSTLSHYDLLLTKIADVIWTLDLEKKFTYISPSVTTLLGYSPAYFVGRSLGEVIGPENSTIRREETDAFFDSVRADPFQRESREIRRFELELATSSGNSIWTETHISTIINSDKKIVNLLGVTRNIQKRKETELALKESYDRLYLALVSCINVMGKTTEIRDPYTAGHQRKVSRLATRIAVEMGLPEETCLGVKYAGQVHDIGKISIPAEIINKPRRLSKNERKMINTHCEVGYEILRTIDFPWPLAEIVLQHHERIDGSGYPRGLKGAETLEEAKIIAVADVVEAMASHRPYRPALGLEKALEEINLNRGLLYEDEVVDHCLRVMKENPTLLQD